MIQFRNLVEDDLAFLLEVRNDLTTRSMLENNQVFTLTECKDWFFKSQPEWLIILNNNNEKIGYLRLNNDEIGVDIHPDFRRMGYAKASYLKFLKDKKHASLWVFEDNHAFNLYVNLGFKVNGNFKFVRKRKYLQMNFVR